MMPRPLGTLMIACLVTLIAAAYPAAATPIVRDEQATPAARPSVYGGNPPRYIDNISAQLDALNAATQDKPTHPLAFSANLVYAAGFLAPRIPLEVLESYADALAQAGVNRIDINPSPGPWAHQLAGIASDTELNTIQKYGMLAAHIHAQGLQLSLNPEYTPSTDGRLDAFAQWKTEALAAYPAMVQTFQPDVFVVVHEPTTMSGRMGLSVSPDEWADFAQATTQVVKAASLAIRCGAGGLSFEQQYLRAFIALPTLDIFTVDIYNLGGIPTYTDLLNSAKASGKAIVVEETWRTTDASATNGTPGELVGNGMFAALDSKWLDTLAHYAAVQGVETITPFWSVTFFRYVPEGGNGLDPRYTQQVIAAIQAGERTDTFNTYAAIIAQYRMTTN